MSNEAAGATVTERGVPTLRGMEHIGMSVPDLDQAVDFFCDVIGCELLYRHGPYSDDTEGAENWNVRYVGLHPRTVVNIAMLRCGNGANLEIFEFAAPDQNRRMPRFSDVGGAHYCFYVEDMDAAVAYLRERGVEVFPGGAADSPGPEAGRDSTNTHMLTPWGQMIEVITYEHGRDYERDTPLRLWVPNKPASWHDYE
jgi:catechol 2,3-dioxygenase-like lactoylglutathione lyase family enzyme